ncbi:hypothetical protein L3V82_04170 [Thiotrichales bacterium 19S3-7]|nr:hypothetical protein [Thiotrichales bacterium 19S3-7]MCF6802667.1 hypothetical protein [Thiotrichales bacterium 19S3-11]
MSNLFLAIVFDNSNFKSGMDLLLKPLIDDAVKKAYQIKFLWLNDKPSQAKDYQAYNSRRKEVSEYLETMPINFELNFLLLTNPKSEFASAPIIYDTFDDHENFFNGFKQLLQNNRINWLKLSVDLDFSENNHLNNTSDSFGYKFLQNVLKINENIEKLINFIKVEQTHNSADQSYQVILNNTPYSISKQFIISLKLYFDQYLSHQNQSNLISRFTCGYSANTLKTLSKNINNLNPFNIDPDRLNDEYFEHFFLQDVADIKSLVKDNDSNDSGNQKQETPKQIFSLTSLKKKSASFSILPKPPNS